MPQLDWTPQHVTPAAGNVETVEFDKLQLALGETGRVVIFEKPTAVWTHTFKVPVIENGIVQKEQKKGKRGPYEVTAVTFLGRVQCPGKAEIIEGSGQGLDVDNCPVCAEARRNKHVRPPERRFAVNVVKYATDRTGNTPATPFAAACYVYCFTEYIMEKLVNVATEYGGIIGREMKWGPCEPPLEYQKYSAYMPTAENWWQQNPEIGNYVAQVYQHNKLDVAKLELAAAKRVPTHFLERDLQTMLDAWAQAEAIENGTASISAVPAFNGGMSFSDGMANLVAAQPAPVPSAPPAPPVFAPPATGSVPAPVDLSAIVAVAQPSAPPAPAFTPAPTSAPPAPVVSSPPAPVVSSPPASAPPANPFTLPTPAPAPASAPPVAAPTPQAPDLSSLLNIPAPPAPQPNGDGNVPNFQAMLAGLPTNAA